MSAGNTCSLTCECVDSYTSSVAFPSRSGSRPFAISLAWCWLMMVRCVRRPTWSSYRLPSGALLMRMTTECLSISLPNVRLSSVPAFPTTAQLRNDGEGSARGRLRLMSLVTR